jgi:hypothetical protein
VAAIGIAKAAQPGLVSARRAEWRPDTECSHHLRKRLELGWAGRQQAGESLLDSHAGSVLDRHVALRTWRGQPRGGLAVAPVTGQSRGGVNRVRGVSALICHQVDGIYSFRSIHATIGYRIFDPTGSQLIQDWMAST